MKKCYNCKAMLADDRSSCNKCGGTHLTVLDEAQLEELAQLEREETERKANPEPTAEEILEKSKDIRVFTIDEPKTVKITEELGLVFGNSSKQAFWGLSTQANRLTKAYEIALANLKYDAAVLGADAVIGIDFALNNSQGSAAVIAGSSEAVMLLGTAVKVSSH
jgi:uncharacterized protein YbjQ (UPF0145 family)